MIASGIFNLLTTSASITSLIADRFYFSLAPKESKLPFVVWHLVTGLPAATTLDGTSDLIEGRLQFDAYACDYLTTRKITRGIRDLLKDFYGPLSDGTIIRFTGVNVDMDLPFEIGGKGYVFRSVIDLSAFYTEGA